MSKVLHTHVAVEIDRGPEEVWPVVSDYASDTRWRKGVTEMTPDRPGAPEVGTRVREVLELAGKAYTTDTVVTETGPGMAYRFAGDGTSGAVRGGRTVVAGSGPGVLLGVFPWPCPGWAASAVATPLQCAREWTGKSCVSVISGGERLGRLGD